MNSSAVPGPIVVNVNSDPSRTRVKETFTPDFIVSGKVPLGGGRAVAHAGSWRKQSDFNVKYSGFD